MLEREQKGATDQGQDKDTNIDNAKQYLDLEISLCDVLFEWFVRKSHTINKTPQYRDREIVDINRISNLCSTLQTLFQYLKKPSTRRILYVYAILDFAHDRLISRLTSISIGTIGDHKRGVICPLLVEYPRESEQIKANLYRSYIREKLPAGNTRSMRVYGLDETIKKAFNPLFLAVEKEDPIFCEKVKQQKAQIEIYNAQYFKKKKNFHEIYIGYCTICGTRLRKEEKYHQIRDKLFCKACFLHQ